MGPDPKEGEDAGGNRFDTADKAGFDRPNVCHTGEKGGEAKDRANDDETAKSENGIYIDGWHIVKGTGDDGKGNPAQEHRPSCDRQAPPTLDEPNRHHIVNSEKNRGSNPPKETELGNHKIADIAVSGN